MAHKENEYIISDGRGGKVVVRPGSRVGAFVKSSEGILFLGYGVYEGNFYPPGSDIKSPQIKLDSGEYIWGSECWWFPESITTYIRIENNPGVRIAKPVRNDDGIIVKYSIVDDIRSYQVVMPPSFN